MKSNYEKKLIEITKLSKSYNEGLSKKNIENIFENYLNKYLLPNELFILYENINGGCELLFENFYDFEEAISKRNYYISVLGNDWLESWLPLGMDDPFDYLIVLPKEKRDHCEIYYMDLGGGDPNLYLYSNTIENLIDLEINRLKNIQETGRILDYRDLYLQFIPDAYPYFEEKTQKGFYSKNGVRNIYNTLELESLPKEWF